MNNLYSINSGFILYFVTNTEELLPVMSGKRPFGIYGEPRGKSYTATQLKYVLILSCSIIKLFSFSEWGNNAIYKNISKLLYNVKKVVHTQLEEIWKKANS